MELKGLFVLTIMVVICGANWLERSCLCSEPKNDGMALIPDLAGSLQYVKYYSGIKASHLDGMAYTIKKLSGQNNYIVTLIQVSKDGKKCYRSYNSTIRPYRSNDKCHFTFDRKPGKQIFNSIPVFEKNSFAVVYRCGPRQRRKPFTTPGRTIQVLTTKLENNLTKALQFIRRNNNGFLNELPFRYKSLFRADMEDV